MKRVIEGTIGVWSTPYKGTEIGPQQIRQWEPKQLIENVALCANDMAPQWARLGTARIEITFDDDKEMVTNRVSALRVEKERTLAEAQKKATDIEREIQTLLAITYDPGVPA